MIYQCQNDENYTMSNIAGCTKVISGYDIDDLLGNKVVSWVGITHPDDKDRVFAEVDKAIEDRTTWDVDYRVMPPSGPPNWVRERGCAIFENGELKYLQGLVVRADAEVALRKSIEATAARAEAETKEIVEIAQHILETVRSLSMLSINARIEAAHCGTMGKGFAIIAEEIGKIAKANGEHAQAIADRTSSIDSGGVDTTKQSQEEHLAVA